MFTEKELNLIMLSLSMELERGREQERYCKEKINELNQDENLKKIEYESWKIVYEEIKQKREDLENLYNKIHNENLRK